jgi:ComF family protein
MVVSTANTIVRVFLSPLCAGCSTALVRPLNGPVCSACWRGVSLLTAPLCVRCGDPQPSWRTAGPLCPRCRRRPPRYTLARSAGRYDGSLRTILHRFKYGGQRALAEPLAALIEHSGSDLLESADAVVPVPLHPLRTLERGFNQADELARRLHRPVWRMLRRKRPGPPQVSLPAARRHANVRAAFALAPGWMRRLGLGPGSKHLATATVVLVDDVMTTGATLDACSRVLLEAGVRRVGAVTVARAVAGRPSRPRLPPHPSPARRR